MSTKKALKKAFKIIGKVKLAEELEISYQAFNRWYDYGEMPCTEYNGKTMYSLKIQNLTKGEVTIEDLCGHVPYPQAEALKKQEKKGGKNGGA